RGEGEMARSDSRLAEDRVDRLGRPPRFWPATSSIGRTSDPATLAAGPRPGRTSRRGGAGQTPRGRTEGVRPTVARRGGVVEEGGDTRKKGGQVRQDLMRKVE